ncbi:MAG: threonine/serine exporter family protein [Clostridia bacterium]|nr:threonine/serine exporter family protein [Clostridia bacterium]
MISEKKRKILSKNKKRFPIAVETTAAQEIPKQTRDGAFYEELLELAVSLANKLQACGAETYRVEDTIDRIIEAYGVERVDAFVIPSSVMASMETDDGQILTKIRRLKSSETLLDGIERYSALSRRICTEKPSMQEARAMLRETEKKVCRYPLPIFYLAAFLIGVGFGVFFGGGLLEALAAGVCGLAIGAVTRFMGRFRANPFFTSFVCSFILGFLANTFTAIGFGKNADITVIGAIMLLVPGFLFTNSLRDVIYGDTMSGLNRLVQVLIIGVALAFGTSSGVSLARHIFPDFVFSLEPIDHPLWIQCIAGLVGTLGFGLMFNMHGRGIPFAILGSIISWPVCVLCMRIGLAEPIAYLVAAAVSCFYAEIMARIRKFPATSYLMCALVPLIPGSGIYYTMDFIRRGMLSEAYDKGMLTAEIAGSMAVGVLLVSTGFRMWSVSIRNRALRKRARENR